MPESPSAFYTRANDIAPQQRLVIPVALETGGAQPGRYRETCFGQLRQLLGGEQMYLPQPGLTGIAVDNANLW